MEIEVLKWRPRGPVAFATRVIRADGRAGPGAYSLMTCADEITLENQVEYAEHRTKCSPIDALDYREARQITSNLTITLSDYTTEAMIMALLAGKIAAEGSPVAVTNEELPAVEEGQGVQLGGSDPANTITSLVITDSETGSPNTLVADTDYVLDPVYGFVTFKDVSSFTQPFIANYSRKNVLTLAAFKGAQLNRWISFQGVNAANGNRITPVHLFNASISPSSLSLVPDDNGVLSMQGALLADLTRPSSDLRGQYYIVGRGA